MEKYSRNEQIIDGELDNNQVMMHLERGKYFGLNPVGKRIWDLIETPKSFEELMNILLKEFEVTQEQCEREIRAFLEKAVRYEIIVKRELAS
ncbi:MAG: PqqD family peptide modification chaperone [Mangrovibacterium sp.]